MFLFFLVFCRSVLCSLCYPGSLVRSLFPSPLLCTGNPNDQDESRGGILRPYPARDNAPSCGLNNAATSTLDSGQQTLAEPQVSPEDPLGPLPENWEMAYTENGELYFIEYVSAMCYSSIFCAHYLHCRRTTWRFLYFTCTIIPFVRAVACLPRMIWFLGLFPQQT